MIRNLYDKVQGESRVLELEKQLEKAMERWGILERKKEIWIETKRKMEKMEEEMTKLKSDHQKELEVGMTISSKPR